MNVLNNGVALTWLGHASWLLETPGGKRVLLDPWLGNPKCPPAFQGHALDPVDLILVTHGHSDHVADVEPIARRTGALVVGIFDLTTWLAGKGLTKVSGMNKGGTQAIDGIRVTLTDAVHSSSYMEHGESQDLGDPCGLVIELENGYRIYNTGDTAVFGDMKLIAELYRPDLVILPIGDHFTMGPREAAKAIELMGARRVVPNHFGTFPLLTGTPEALRALLPPEVELLVLEPGETLR
jgi:L-ascorbate metabolism protein UlaG (beta-lactamase superfamily)